MPKVALPPEGQTGLTRRARQSGPANDSLAEVQRLMSRALFRPLSAGDRMQRENSATAARIIKPNDRLTSFDRLQIYNQQYWWRLLSNFSDDYPGLLAVLGQRKFDRLAVAYLEAHGSTSWTLRNLGQYLVAFLEKHPELTAPYSALALDMARVEWAKTVAFDDPELPVVDPQKIARRDPSTLRLKVQPYVSLLSLRHPIDRLLTKLREANIETGSASNAVAATKHSHTRLIRSKPERKPIFLAVHRVDFLIYYKRLEPESFKLLTALRDGATLADACEAAFKRSKIKGDAAAQKIGEWFNTWTQLGWLAR